VAIRWVHSWVTDLTKVAPSAAMRSEIAPCVNPGKVPPTATVQPVSGGVCAAALAFAAPRFGAIGTCVFECV
jgi:hypothetical protein